MYNAQTLKIKPLVQVLKVIKRDLFKKILKNKIYQTCRYNLSCYRTCRVDTNPVEKLCHIIYFYEHYMYIFVSHYCQSYLFVSEPSKLSCDEFSVNAFLLICWLLRPEAF